MKFAYTIKRYKPGQADPDHLWTAMRAGVVHAEDVRSAALEALLQFPYEPVNGRLTLEIEPAEAAKP